MKPITTPPRERRRKQMNEQVIKQQEFQKLMAFIEKLSERVFPEAFIDIPLQMDPALTGEQFYILVDREILTELEKRAIKTADVDTAKIRFFGVEVRLDESSSQLLDIGESWNCCVSNLFYHQVVRCKIISIRQSYSKLEKELTQQLTEQILTLLNNDMLVLDHFIVPIWKNIKSKYENSSGDATDEEYAKLFDLPKGMSFSETYDVMFDFIYDEIVEQLEDTLQEFKKKGDK